MMNEQRKKIVAVAMLSLMVLATLFGAVGFSDESEAASDSWACKITVSGTSLTTTYSKTGGAFGDMTQVVGTSSNAGSWGYDEKGYGPFGSFYAAFDPAQNNAMVCHLNPSKLTLAMDGTDISGKNYNIMWCLPKIYLSVSGSTITLASDDSYGGTLAPAFTVGGTDYNYFALGVYEATYVNSKIGSVSGQSPQASTSLATYRTEVKSVRDAMTEGSTAILWNFHQYQLYRLCSLAVMENFDSQTQIGYGNSNGSKSSTTGTMDTNGPYYGTSGQNANGAKLFIENAWGSLFEYVDDAWWSTGLYAGQNVSPTSNTSNKTKLSALPTTLNGYGTAPYSTDISVWGLPTATGSSSTTAPDYIYTGSSGYALIVGGNWGNTSGAGLSFLYTSGDGGDGYGGTRLAFLFAADTAATNTPTVTYDHSALANMGVSTDGLTTEIEIEDETTTYTNLGTVGGYTHIGWYVDNTFYSVNHTVATTESHTAYSAWRAPSITITYMVEGEVYSTLEVPKGSVGIVFTPQQVEGVFMGWYYDASYSDKYDATVALTKDTELYAKGVKPLTFTSVPTANATITNIDANGLVYFDATENAGRLSVLWDFGDGNTSTDPIAYNSYAKPGTYDVTLTVTNALGETAQKTYQVVYAGPEDTPDDSKDPTLLYVIIGLIVLVALISIARRFI